MKMENLIEDYKNNFTIYALVFKFMKIQYMLINVFVLLLLFSTYSIFVAIPIGIINFELLKVVIIIFVCILITSLALLKWFTHSAGRIIFKRYGIQSTTGGWRPKEFDDMQTKMLTEYLKNQKLYTSEKLETLVTNLKDLIERKKSPSIWVAGVFLALFTPLWNQYMMYLFKMAEIKNWLNVSEVVLIASLGIGFFSLYVGGFKKMLFFVQDLFMTESHSILGAKLLEHIQSLQLVYEDPKNSKNLKESEKSEEKNIIL